MNWHDLARDDVERKVAAKLQEMCVAIDAPEDEIKAAVADTVLPDVCLKAALAMRHEGSRQWLAERSTPAWYEEDTEEVQHGFVIIWNPTLPNNPKFHEALKALGIAPGDWGYDDSYTTCTECGRLIEFVHHGTPDYWLDEPNGEVYCFKCFRGMHQWYLDSLAEHGQEDLTCLLSADELREAGLLRVLHHCDCSDYCDGDFPERVISHLKRQGFEVLCVLSEWGYGHFDVWIRLGGGCFENWTACPEYITAQRALLVERVGPLSEDILFDRFRADNTPEDCYDRATFTS